MTGTERAATILVVDDQATNLAILTHVLQPLYRVRAARSGEQALNIAAGEPHPALILLDVMMPGMDGYQVLASLKAAPATRDIPVIFLTALSAAEDEERGLSMGAVDYIAKPFHPGVVLARVQTHLDLKAARDFLMDQNAFLEAEVARRVEEKRRIELQLLQSEKMAAIGLLAAGIAHEINNPVSYAASNLDALGRYVGDVFEVLDAYRALRESGAEAASAQARLAEIEQIKDLDFIRTDIRDLIAESREGVQRVRDIARDLKVFSRKEEGDWQWADVHIGLDSTLRIVWNELKYNCTVFKEYAELPPVYCMPSQLNQVFLNLLVNAAQAIETRGDIHIRTGHDGEEVWIEVADTGKGISPEQQRLIFDPFFTTKPVGQGTGLGLSLSSEIVAKHGGHIEVRSKPGEGAAFRVVLPIKGAAEARMGDGSAS